MTLEKLLDNVTDEHKLHGMSFSYGREVLHAVRDGWSLESMDDGGETLVDILRGHVVLELGSIGGTLPMRAIVEILDISVIDRLVHDVLGDDINLE